MRALGLCEAVLCLVLAATPAGAPPPGVILDKAGKALRYPGRTWTLLGVDHVDSWDARTGWNRSRSVSPDESGALKHAVAGFNAIAGLRLKLEYAETGDPGFSLKDQWKNKDRLVVYWGQDAAEGALGKPFKWRDGSYITGCSTVVKDPAGRFDYLRAAGVPPGGEIAGGMMYMVEFSTHIRGLYKCKADGPYYVTLHELGHCLGLSHDTPAPSIMHGTCGTSYMPNDVAALRYLYGDPVAGR